MAHIQEPLRKAVECDSPAEAPCTAIDEFMALAMPSAISLAEEVVGWMGRRPCLEPEDLANRASRPLWRDPHRDHPGLKAWIDAGPGIRSRAWRLLVWRGKDVLKRFGLWEKVQRDILSLGSAEAKRGELPLAPEVFDVIREATRDAEPVDRPDLLERLAAARETFLELARSAWRVQMRLVAFAAGFEQEVYQPLPLGPLTLTAEEESELGENAPEYMQVLKGRQAAGSADLARLLNSTPDAVRANKDRAPEYLFKKTVRRGAKIQAQRITSAKILAWLARGDGAMPPFLSGRDERLPTAMRPHWNAIERALDGGPVPYEALGVRPEDVADLQARGVQEFFEEVVGLWIPPA